MTKTITCPKCGLVDCFYTVEKANNHVAYCGGCKAYIKNIAYQEPKFYFGKYKGHLISAIEDLQYLQWALNNIKMSESIRDAVRNQINTLHELLR
jgi:hypothetical protein